MPRPIRMQNPPAQHFEHALEAEHDKSEQAETDQRRQAAARQHSVVDLQHEQRAGERQQIDQATGDADADEGVAIGGDRRW